MNPCRPKTAIVIPCFNEAGRIKLQAFSDFLNSGEHIRLIFVNDGSTDETPVMLNRFCGAHAERSQVIHCDRNRGKAAAVWHGLRRAVDMGVDAAGYWDADLSTPLCTVEDLLTTLERKETLIAMGARVKLLGRCIERKASRHYLGRVFATAASWVLGVGVYDTQCGAKLFRNDELLQAAISERFLTNWSFDVEILLRYKLLLESKGRSLYDSVVEHPLLEWRHCCGSKLTAAAAFKSGLELLLLGALAQRLIPVRRFSKRLLRRVH